MRVAALATRRALQPLVPLRSVHIASPPPFTHANDQSNAKSTNSSTISTSNVISAEHKAPARSAGVDPQGKTPRFFKLAAPAPATTISKPVGDLSSGISNKGLQEGKEQPVGWVVELDGRPVRTPGNALLLLPSEALAATVALEWEAQRQRIEPGTMRLMTLCATSIDVVAPKRTKVIDALLSYMKSDTSSCRVSEDPELARLQDREFEPLHTWFSQEFNLPPPPVARSVFAEEVPEQTLMELQWLLFDLSDFELAGLEIIAHASKSLVIALAVWRNRLTFADALRLTTLEEHHQRKEWGDMGGMDQEMADADLRVRLASGDLFLQLCTPAR